MLTILATDTPEQIVAKVNAVPGLTDQQKESLIRHEMLHLELGRLPKRKPDMWNFPFGMDVAINKLPEAEFNELKGNRHERRKNAKISRKSK